MNSSEMLHLYVLLENRYAENTPFCQKFQADDEPVNATIFANE